MNFDYQYTEEQETFRVEARAWLEENVPDDMAEPVDRNDLTDEQYAFARDLDVRLAEKGWLSPTMPAEYGGGGLSQEHAAIIAEEFFRKGLVSPVSGSAPPALVVWGTEEQKQEFLTPILKGEKTSVILLTEPKGGADLAALETRAVRDGDDWLITGAKCFISHRRTPDLMFGPAITDPDSPRHRNLGYFVIPVPSPGLTLEKQDLLVGNEQLYIHMDNVRVPGRNLIGGDHQGWQVTQTALGDEQATPVVGVPRRPLFQMDAIHEWFSCFPWQDMVGYLQTTPRDGKSIGGDPLVQQTAIDCYLEAHIYNLLARRNFWMYHSGEKSTYHGHEADVHKRSMCVRNVTRIREIMGMYTHLNGEDPLAPLEGLPDVCGRDAYTAQHGHGSMNIAKVVLARQLGISRTQR